MGAEAGLIKISAGQGAHTEEIDLTTPFFNPGTRDGFDGSGPGSYDGWLPVEYGDEAIQALAEDSAVEMLARQEPMAENTKTVPRFANFTVGNVAKGQQYVASVAYEDQIDLTAKKVGGFTRIAEEDLRDLVADPLAAKRVEAARALAKEFDNSCLGTTGAANTTTIKYTSVYRKVRFSQTDTDGFDAEFGYSDDDNYIAITPAELVAPTTSATNGYDALSDLLSLVEDGEFNDGELAVIAHPSIRGKLRKIKDANGQPVMTQNGVDLRGNPTYDFFGHAFAWSRGARTHAVNSQSPSGNPLVIVAVRRMLVKGNRALSPQIPASTFGVALQRSGQGPGFLSDEAYMKAAYRRAFVPATALGLAVLEVDPTA